MLKVLRKLWRRWVSWSLPTKISIVGTIASVVSLALYFLDLRPFLERLVSPPQVVRNISVRINNPEKTRSALLQWYRIRSSGPVLAFGIRTLPQSSGLALACAQRSHFQRAFQRLRGELYKIVAN